MGSWNISRTVYGIGILVLLGCAAKLAQPKPIVIDGTGQAYASLVLRDASVSGYSSDESQTDSSPYITASNQRVREGIVATNCLPLHAWVELDGKEYQVEDRMNKRYTCYGVWHFDIWFSSKEEAFEYGRRAKVVRIIPPPPSVIVPFP